MLQSETGGDKLGTERTIERIIRLRKIGKIATVARRRRADWWIASISRNALSISRQALRPILVDREKPDQMLARAGGYWAPTPGIYRRELGGHSG